MDRFRNQFIITRKTNKAKLIGNRKTDSIKTSKISDAPAFTLDY